LYLKTMQILASMIFTFTFSQTSFTSVHMQTAHNSTHESKTEHKQ